ncbi:DUF1643 domain-containing protein [Nevskia ramosa]|uniref:DUF1643 domain-containing protein n=1 Tax=Nevskia ramosa TaxID=64002 RepID=UPI003D0AA8D0
MIVRTHVAGGITSEAVFSDCERYRYSLTRSWSSRPLVAFVLMNPSTATEVINDPTIERCQRRAAGWNESGYLPNGGIAILNAFAWRETDSRKLPLRIAEGIDIAGGFANDDTIHSVVNDSAMVICGWGKPGRLIGRDRHVLQMLRAMEADPHALKINADGTPCHPLYIPYSALPIPLQ